MAYTFAALALAATLLSSGCGQIGPLYEPQENTLLGKPAHSDPMPTTAS